jgi:hypothetical protein
MDQQQAYRRMSELIFLAEWRDDVCKVHVCDAISLHPSHFLLLFAYNMITCSLPSILPVATALYQISVASHPSATFSLKMRVFIDSGITVLTLMYELSPRHFGTLFRIFNLYVLPRETSPISSPLMS